MNKRGQMTGMLYFIGALFIALFAGFMMSVGVAFIDWTADQTLPELQNLGQAGDVNLTEISDLTITPLNTLVQAMPGIVGVMYVMMLMASLGMAYMFRAGGERWLLFLFFGLSLLLVIASIGISMVYEDFYDDDGEFGDRLREQSLMSFLILYSPAIMTVIAMAGAMIMFTGYEEVGGGV